MVNEIDEMTKEWVPSELEDYLMDLSRYVLESNNATIYEAFFSTLVECNVPFDELFYDHIISPDNSNDVMYYAYAHVLMTGDTEAYVCDTCTKSAYNVMCKYLDYTPTENMRYGYEYTKIFEFLVWLITTGKYTVHDMLRSAEDEHKDYLLGRLTYDDVKKIEEKELQKKLLDLIKDLENMNEL
jgi:hypothetical protein